MRGRRRSISRQDAPVWCPGGRWGGRRVRTNECQMRVRCEDLYVALLREQPKGNVSVQGAAERLPIGSRGANWLSRGRHAPIRSGGSVECFLGALNASGSALGSICPALTQTSAVAGVGDCRMPPRRYKTTKSRLGAEGRLRRMFGTTQRDWAYETTNERRGERRAECEKRWNKRKRHLRKAERLANPQNNL